MNLQLAENGVKAAISEFYIPVPTRNGGAQLIREDYLDNLSDESFNQYLDDLEATGVNMGDKAKREARKARRAERKQAKTDKKTAKTAIKLAKAEGIKAGTYQSTGGQILGGLKDIAGNIFGGGEGTEKFSASYDSDAPPAADDTQKPPYVLYAVGAAALIAVVFLVMKKKK